MRGSGRLVGRLRTLEKKGHGNDCAVRGVDAISPVNKPSSGRKWGEGRGRDHSQVGGGWKRGAMPSGSSSEGVGD